MVLGKKSRSCNSSCCDLISGVDNESSEMGLVKYGRTQRKRVGLYNSGSDSISRTPLKKHCARERMILNSEKETCALQALPEEILIQIVSGVDHEDLNQLNQVAKFIREAALVAEKIHFAFSTPKKGRAFTTAIDLEDVSEDIEAPNAPKQTRARGSRLTAKKLGSISVNLFGEPDKDSSGNKDTTNQF
ncbi:F-box protein SKIP27-like [Humulus lupulus]|uniref:F-box protein SKIP27-like n=1 Tax=Humulus lupulus TaxID=3486 RepID=UPI002B40A57C|nr:F-box protein SKIP27-like [Humulus lupulus]